ncbi:MAG: response regulator [Holophagae bacterium]|jgi:signal transduction histidine kinase
MNDDAEPRVLLVDDERDFLESLRQRLELRGLPVRAASSGPEALEMLDDGPVDVVVLDVRMPGMDGIETLRRIKEKHPHTEVVMLTGHADLETSLEGMRFGFFDYLTKPVKVDLLIEKINEAHRRGRGERVESGAETFTDKLQEHVIVADRLASLGELAASIAHEINNPLAVISEAAGWLRSTIDRGTKPPEEIVHDAGRALSKIEAAVDRAARISQNFLRFSRGPDANLREVDLGALAAEVRDLLHKTAAAANIEITVEFDHEEPVLVTTDPFQLRQVLLNLVTNAVQAIERNGRVVIEIVRDQHCATVAVADNGPGIHQDHLERIFEPFFTTKAEGHGTGLGLAVSRGIVEKLGGRLEVDNRVGEGCTFRVALPLEHE